VEEIVTGEAVVLDLPCARFPTRLLARLIDMIIQVVLLAVVLVLAYVAVAGGRLDTAGAAAVYITAIVLVIVGYPVIFETLSRGRTIGKMAIGLRVVADDGGPVRFRHALVRALAGAIECWALSGVPALITMMMSARGKRLGDIFAGTFVLRERAPQPAASALTAGPWAAGAPAPGFAGGRRGTRRPYPGGPYPGGPYLAGGPQAASVPVDPLLRPWASALDLSALPDGLAASASSYLSRYRQLDPSARDYLGIQLAAGIWERVSPPPPPGVPPVVFLHTVLAERRNRELARMWAAQQQAAWPAVQPGSPLAPPPAAQPPAAQPPVAQPEPERPADAGGFAPPA
jgi:uncharacterized RDD family membrane protein YckC